MHQRPFCWRNSRTTWAGRDARRRRLRSWRAIVGGGDFPAGLGDAIMRQRCNVSRRAPSGTAADMRAMNEAVDGEHRDPAQVYGSSASKRASDASLRPILGSDYFDPSPPGAKYPSRVATVRSSLLAFSAILWKPPSLSILSGV